MSSLLMHADSAIDNPTYDECQGTSMANNLTANHELERDFENPIYGDDTEIGVNSTSKADLPIQSTSLYSESTEVNTKVQTMVFKEHMLMEPIE